MAAAWTRRRQRAALQKMTSRQARGFRWRALRRQRRVGVEFKERQRNYRTALGDDQGRPCRAARMDPRLSPQAISSALRHSCKITRISRRYYQPGKPPNNIKSFVTPNLRRCKKNPDGRDPSVAHAVSAPFIAHSRCGSLRQALRQPRSWQRRRMRRPDASPPPDEVRHRGTNR
jgi:hypothetical protein